MPKLKAFQKIQTRLVRELEKKFSGKHVMFVGERKILPKPTRKTRTKNKQKRPRRYVILLLKILMEYTVYILLYKLIINKCIFQPYLNCSV